MINGVIRMAKENKKDNKTTRKNNKGNINLQEYLESISGQIEKIADKRNEEIKKLMESQSSSSRNPIDSMERSFHIASQIDEISEAMNQDIVSVLTNALNQIKSMVSFSKDSQDAIRLNALIANLSTILTKVVSKENKATEAQKQSAKNQAIERRYVWDYYQETIKETNYITHLLLNQEVNKDDYLIALLGLRSIGEALAYTVEHSGNLPDGIYEKIHDMDKYAKRNEIIDELDLTRTQDNNDFLFKKNKKGEYESGEAFDAEDKTLTPELKRIVSALEADRQLYFNIAKEGGLDNARQETLAELKERIVREYECFKLASEEKYVNPELVSNIDKFCKKIDFIKATDANRGMLIDSSNEMQKIEERVRLNAEEAKKIELSKEDKAEVDRLLEDYHSFLEVENEAFAQFGTTSVEKNSIHDYNASRKQIYEAFSYYKENVEDAYKSAQCLKKIESALDNTIKVALDKYVNDVSKDILSQEELIEKFGGRKKLEAECRVAASESLNFDDSSTYSAIDDTKASKALQGYKYYSLLIENKKQLTALYNKYKDAETISEEDKGLFLELLGKLNGYITRIPPTNTLPKVASDIKKTVENGKDFVFISMNGFTNDINFINRHKEIHESILKKLPKEHTNFKALVSEEKKGKASGKDKKVAKTKSKKKEPKIKERKTPERKPLEPKGKSK